MGIGAIEEEVRVEVRRSPGRRQGEHPPGRPLQVGPDPDLLLASVPSSGLDDLRHGTFPRGHGTPDDASKAVALPEDRKVMGFVGQEEPGQGPDLEGPTVGLSPALPDSLPLPASA